MGGPVTDDKLTVRSLNELLSLEPPDIPFLVEPQLLPYGGSLVLYGIAGTWKTFLSIDLMFALAGGRRWIIYETNQCKVLMVQTEVVELMYRGRLLKYTEGHFSNGSKPESVDPNLLFSTSRDLKLDNFRGQALLEETIVRERPNVVILDCLYRTVESTKEERSLKALFDHFAHLQDKYATAFVIIHHPRKEDQRADSESQSFEDMTGWAGVSYWADTIIRVSHVDKHRDIIKLAFEKVKNAVVEVPDVNVRIDRATLRFTIS